MESCSETSFDALVKGQAIACDTEQQFTGGLGRPLSQRDVAFGPGFCRRMVRVP